MSDSSSMLSSGTLSGRTLKLSSEAGLILGSSEGTGYVAVIGGSDATPSSGAKLYAYSAGSSTTPGSFNLQASNATNTKQLLGSPDGSLTWDGKAVVTEENIGSLGGSGIESSGSNYIRYADGTQVCWGQSTSGTTNSTVTVTFGAAFKATPIIIYCKGNSSYGYAPDSYGATTTKVTFTCNDDYYVTASFVAFGKWK